MVDAVTGRAPQADGKNTVAAGAKKVKVEFVADERTRAEQATLDRLTHAIDDMRRSRKSAAAEEVARLKKQLELLRLLGATNPQAMARELARLAKELGAAARSYAGTDGIGAMDAPPSPPGGADAAATDTATTETAAPTAAAAVTPPPAEPARPAVVEAVMHAYGKAQAVFDQQQADARFAADVRGLYAQLKMLFDEARKRADAEHKDADLNTAAKAIAAAGETIDQALGVDPVGLPAASPGAVLTA